MPKLYQVHIRGYCYVVADNEREAERIAESAVQNEGPYTCGCQFGAGEYVGGLPEQDWAGAYPFGDNKDMTVNQWIDAMDEWNATE
jgi:hypothetical protein